MLSITKRLEFDAGHRLLNHESKCFFPHGHRWIVEVECQLATGHDLDDVGRIVDFGVVKGLLGKWIDENLDHVFIANVMDPLIPHMISLGKRDEKKPVYIVPFEPSSENLVKHLHQIFSSILESSHVRVTRLDLYETPSSRATYVAPD